MKAWLISLVLVFTGILGGFLIGKGKGYTQGVTAGYAKAYQEDKYLRSFERDMRAQEMKHLRAEIAAKQALLAEMESVASRVAATGQR